MDARMPNPATLLPDAVTGVQQIFQAMHQGGAPAATLELVHLRVSQINGCSACVHGGVASAQKAGETVERLLMVATWRESDLFTPAERGALAVAEAATRLADTPEAVTDELWADLTEHHDDKAVSAIILMVALTNFFNRINTTIRQPAGATWS
ncbi:MAG TPA: carboxymuconolactone decarboxylase family protein [Iamia sp.]|nr:carboxymuconolactone decarboxylase family protein [Iamia sp.]